METLSECDHPMPPVRNVVGNRVDMDGHSDAGLAGSGLVVS